jgi:hypothetical protein
MERQTYLTKPAAISFSGYGSSQYGLADRGIWVRFTGGARDFLLSTASRPALRSFHSQQASGALHTDIAAVELS